MISLRRMIVIAMSVYSVSVSTIALYIFIENSNKFSVQVENVVVESSRTKIEVESNVRAFRLTKNGTCPEYAQGLHGPLTVDESFIPSEEQAIKSAGARVADGCFEPPDCNPNQTVAIIIPFKNRQQHLVTLLHHLHPILQRQKIRYCIFVPEQYDDGAFNKARVMNAAFLEIMERNSYRFDCLVFHDVDMLLEDDRNLYKCADKPRHLSPAIDKFDYKVGYGTDFGGVGAVTVEQYKLVNGHSNRFYGWGGEDSDIETRFALNMIRSVRNNATFGRYKMIPHIHTRSFSPNSGLGSFFKGKDQRLLGVPSDFMRRTDDSGLSSIKYAIKNVTKHRLYTKMTIDVRTFLINGAKAKILGQGSNIEVENPSLTNGRLGVDSQVGIRGFGIVAGDDIPNYKCTYRRFLKKTVNMTLGIVMNATYMRSYHDLQKAKAKCIELTEYCASILETRPGVYELRSSGFMHELTLKYKFGRYPQKLITQTHTDVSVYAKICPKDVRYAQYINDSIVLASKDEWRRNLQHEIQFEIQLFQVESLKLYYTYSVYSSHKATMEESERLLNTSFGRYDSLSVTKTNSILVFDTEEQQTYEEFLSGEYSTLQQVAGDHGTITLTTRASFDSLIPGCYICESAIKDQNGGVHMSWKWWFEIRGKTPEIEAQILKQFLPNAPVGTTWFTEKIMRKFQNGLQIPGQMQLPDNVMKILAQKQMNDFK